MVKIDIEKAKELSMGYFGGDDLAANSWIKKYALKDQSGNLYELTPKDMHKRLAAEFARVEMSYVNPMSEELIFGLLDKFKFIVPQGSPMYGIGNKFVNTSLSNCFVVESAYDSYGGIMKTDQEQVQMMKRRGGVGHDLSTIRPSGATANNSVLGQNAGMPLYMERFSNSTREVSQDGRRGALMLSVSVHHPDVDKFIDSKLVQGKVTGANISVRIDDEFMDAVEKDLDFIQTFPVDLEIDGNVAFQELLINGWVEYNKLYSLAFDGDSSFDNCYAKRVKARDIWDKIIRNAWASAEPGILFWDNIIRESPADCYAEYGFKTKSTNPCGEIPLCPYDSCRLLAMNLYSYVENPFTPQAKFNFDLFREHVAYAQRMMDDLVDLELERLFNMIEKVENDPEPYNVKEVELTLWNKIKQKANEGRRTGLGITAEGDMLAALGLRYGSEEATSLSEEVHKQMALASYASSIQMAKERGSFPIWDLNLESENPFINRIIQELPADVVMDYTIYGRRNISNLTIAPTGTTSLLTQTTSGIEPVFLPFYKRRTKTEDKSKATFIDEVGDGWIEYFVIHPKFIEWYDLNWYKIDSHLFDIDYHKPIEEYDEDGLIKLFEKSPYFKSTSADVDWQASVKMQGRIQKWVDHSISKTVNIPSDTSVEEVNKIYRAAWKSGCKGVTIYREGSRSGVLVSSKNDEKKTGFSYLNAFKRPKVTDVDIYRKKALKQDWMVIVGKIDGKPYEIFCLKDVSNSQFPYRIKSGILTKVKGRVYRLEAEYEGKTYVIENIIDLMSENEQVDTRKFSSMLRHGMDPKWIVQEIEEYATVVSFDKVVQRVLKEYVDDTGDKPKCPECGSENYVIEEGCSKCLDCGHSKCG